MKFSPLDLTDPGRLRAIAFDLRVAADAYDQCQKHAAGNALLSAQFTRQAAESRLRADQLNELANQR